MVGDALLVGRVDALEADWDLSCPVSAPKRVPCGQGLRSRLGMGHRARIKAPIPEHCEVLVGLFKKTTDVFPHVGAGI